MKMWVLTLFVLFLGLMVVGSISFADEVGPNNPPPILGKPVNNPPQVPQEPQGPEVAGPPPVKGRPLSQTPPPPPKEPERAPAVPGEDLTMNIDNAIRTARTLLRLIEPGKIWIMKAPRGEIEVKGALLYQGVVIGSVNIDPISGIPLPLGYKKMVYREPDILPLREEFEKAVRQLEIAPGVEFREPERSWIIPLIWRGRIIGTIKIFYDGIHVVPDYKAEEEMTIFGR